MHRVNLA